MLRTYRIGANQNVFVDTDQYLMHDTLLISNQLGLGDDEGFSLSGPAAPGSLAVLAFANPLDKKPVIELNNADFVTLNRLHGWKGGIGLYLRGASDHFKGIFLTFFDNTGEGVRIESLSKVEELSHLQVVNNGGSAICW